jgi:hypothetical protein
MSDERGSDGVVLELTTHEAMIVVAALRQFEPYWPSDSPEPSRVALLADIRGAIDHLVQTLQPNLPQTS